MSRFSSLQSVIDFCIVQLETEVASNPGKKVLSIVRELESYSEKGQRPDSES